MQGVTDFHLQVDIRIVVPIFVVECASTKIETMIGTKIKEDNDRDNDRDEDNRWSWVARPLPRVKLQPSPRRSPPTSALSSDGGSPLG